MPHLAAKTEFANNVHYVVATSIHVTGHKHELNEFINTLTIFVCVNADSIIVAYG